MQARTIHWSLDLVKGIQAAEKKAALEARLKSAKTAQQFSVIHAHDRTFVVLEKKSLMGQTIARRIHG